MKVLHIRQEIREETEVRLLSEHKKIGSTLELLGTIKKNRQTWKNEKKDKERLLEIKRRRIQPRKQH